MMHLFDEAESLVDVGPAVQSSLLLELQSINLRYEDLEEFDRGGSKIIYTCIDKYTERQIALAFLKDSSEPQKVEAFLHEARLNATLQHPNIIPVYDIGVIDGEPFYGMKFIEGRSLKKIIEEIKAGNSLTKKTFSVNVLLDVFLKICEAISYAHSQNVIHLDLKPANICIDKYGAVLVCDWGLAEFQTCVDSIAGEFDLVEEHSLEHFNFEEMTVDGFVKGSPGYMAPEQTGLIDLRKGPQTDVYSLGAILYSLLTFRAPLEGELNDVLKQTVAGDIPPLSNYREDIPAQLTAICSKAMAVDPQNRYQTVKALSKDILAYRDGYATSADNASFFTLLYLYTCRNKTISAILLIASLSVFLISIAFTVNLSESRNIALKSQTKSLMIADQLRDEKQRRIAREKEMARQVLAKYKSAYKAYQFDEALDFLNLAVELDGTLQEAWLYKARIHCSREEFNAAINAYDRAGNKEKLYELSRQFQKIKNDDSSKLKLDDYMSLFIQAVDHYGLKDRLFRDFLHQKIYSEISLDERMLFIRKSILMRRNKKYSALNFSFDRQTKHLDVSNNTAFSWAYAFQNFPATSADLSYTSINSFTCFRSQPLLALNVSHTSISSLVTLSNKNLRELNISHTAIGDLSPLKNIPLQVLDISHCPITSLSILNSLRQLKTLYISEGQFTPQYLSKVPENVVIEIR